MAQHLVAAAAAAAVPATNTLRYAAAPKPNALEEGRLSIGMALAHVAQRLGHAHVSRRGWFGSQQVREHCMLFCLWRPPEHRQSQNILQIGKGASSSCCCVCDFQQARKWCLSVSLCGSAGCSNAT
jgi:hypothetical protein